MNRMYSTTTVTVQKAVVVAAMAAAKQKISVHCLMSREQSFKIFYNNS